MANSESELSDFLECSICLDTLCEPKILPCAHRFCRNCLRQEIERNAKTRLHVTFPCPQCRKSVPLTRKNQGEEYVELLETDRLLRKIIDNIKKDPDVCASHGLRREVVCYVCQETGCLRCAWTRHRNCSKTGEYQLEVYRVQCSLQDHLEETKKCLEDIDLYVKSWSRTVKSYENQIKYSNAFVEKFIKSEKKRFGSRVSSLKDSWELYLRTHLISTKKLAVALANRIQTVFGTLNFDVKLDDAKIQIVKEIKSLKGQVYDASRRLRNAPKRTDLAKIAEEISHILQLEKHEMVVSGEKLLTENKSILSKNYRRHVQKVTSKLPNSYLLPGVITREAHVHLGIEQEDERLEKLSEVLETADDSKELLDELDEIIRSNSPTSDWTNRNCFFRYVVPLFLEGVYRGRTLLASYFSNSMRGIRKSWTSVKDKCYDFYNLCSNIFVSIFSVLKFLFKVTFMVVVLIGVVYGLLRMSIGGYKDLVVALFVIIIGIITMGNHENGGRFIIYPFSPGQRRRRRRRNAVIEHIATSNIDDFFHMQRPVIVQQRTRIR